MIEIDREEERRLDLCEEAEHREAMEDRAGEVPPTVPRERPIIFSGPMVRAILDGRKTQTRRVISEQPGWDPQTLPLRVVAEHPDLPRTQAFFGDGLGVGCPYGKPGDRLWVRETLREGPAGWSYAADESLVLVDRSNETQMLAWAHHKQGGICPTIHMPRWASRLVRTVVAIRVERLQDISEEDARAEGMKPEAPMRSMFGLKPSSEPVWVPCTHREAFAVRWDEINGKRAPWESNPWVWVVTFAPIEAGS